LQDNLDFEKVRYEQRNEKERFAVIPVKQSYTSLNNKDKHPFNYLVVTVDQQNNLTTGNLIQFIPDGEGKPVPQNTFAKIFNHQKLDANGKFTVLSVADDFRYELSFEKGSLKSITEKKSKKSATTGRMNEYACIDWYLQTWAVWEDGSMTLISEVYVGTTCGDGCAQAKVVSGKNFRLGCSGGNGGGGDIDYEYEIIKTKKATFENRVHWINSGDGGGSCFTTQILYANFHQRRPEKDAIYECFFVKSEVKNNTIGASSSITTYTPSNINKTTINIGLTGRINYPDGTFTPFSNNTEVRMNDFIWY